MLCPLCSTGLKKNLLLASLALLSCPNEQCVYPFNLTMEEIQLKKLVIKVTEAEIMRQMTDKLSEAGVESELSNFIARDDPEVMDTQLRR